MSCFSNYPNFHVGQIVEENADHVEKRWACSVEGLHHATPQGVICAVEYAPSNKQHFYRIWVTDKKRYINRWGSELQLHKDNIIPTKSPEEVSGVYNE